MSSPRRPAAALSLFLSLFLLAATTVPLVAEEAPASSVTEHVTVTASRLPPEPEPLDHVPAHVTVIDREQIERSGARTLQDLLALEAGVVLYDQVGNDIEKTLDLRGFNTGSGTRVLLDGAPLNDTRNNGLVLELVPLAALERIEIVRGSAGALMGGGSEAGTINLVTQRGGPLAFDLGVAAGSDGAARATGDLRSSVGRFDFFAAGSYDENDGFRENADGDLRRLAATAGMDLGSERRLALSVVDGRSDLGNPGALNASEFAADPGLAPFNQLDFSEQRLTQASLNYHGPLKANLSLSANVFARRRDSEILSTGRSAAIFGGFFLDAEAADHGATTQLTWEHRAGRTSNALAAGLEWLDGATDALGYFTPPTDPGQVDLANPASKNTAGRRTLGLYVQNRFSPTPALGLVLGLRADNDRVEYEDAFDPTLDNSRRFSEVSLRAGATYQLTERQGLYASYGEAFLPPTVEELFSFPLFFSNPDLRPEDSQCFEVGWRGHFERVEVQTALFSLNTDDEIVFVPDPPPALFTGANQNIGRTSRQGIEASVRAKASKRLHVFANLTWTDAEIRSGADRGHDVPLVPRERAAGGLEVQLPGRIDLRAEALYVGEQVLDNDSANAQGALASYTVVNTQVAWRPAFAQSHTTPQADRGPRLFAEVRNLFDRTYATRGIFVGEAFFTPAPGRRYFAGAEWRF